VIEIPHVIVGVAMATKVGSPALAISLSFASHFVLDRIPHWNPHFYTETKKFGHPSTKSTIFAVADSLIALFVGLGFAAASLPDYTKALTIIACCFAAVISDQIKLPFFYFKGARCGLMKKWVSFERSMQGNASFWPGIVTQILIVAASLWWIFS
jgi:hypothetical protein